MSMKDSRKFTLLTYAAYKNLTNCFKIIFEYVTKFNIDRRLPSNMKMLILRNWVNLKADDNFTALHFAAKHGNCTMLKFLVEKAGADMELRNKHGANVMHTAAQYDQALSLYFFYTKGVDINVKDQKLSTPLHWACYMRSDMALNYILSMKPNIEAPDVQGYTPLHIAVASAEKLGSTRNVKSLLLRGAKRDARDKTGRTPLDMVRDNKCMDPLLRNELM